MNQEVTKHLDDSISFVKAIFDEAVTLIEALKPGEKIPATKLAESLGKSRKLTTPQIYPTLLFLINKNYPGVWILKGAHGGIYRPTAEDIAKKAAKDAEKAAATTDGKV